MKKTQGRIRRFNRRHQRFSAAGGNPNERSSKEIQGDLFKLDQLQVEWTMAVQPLPRLQRVSLAVQTGVPEKIARAQEELNIELLLARTREELARGKGIPLPDDLTEIRQVDDVLREVRELEAQTLKALFSVCTPQSKVPRRALKDTLLPVRAPLVARRIALCRAAREARAPQLALAN